MNAPSFDDRVAAAWLAKLPASKAEGTAIGFDGRAWLAGLLEDQARSRAEAVFLGLDSFMAGGNRTATDLAEHIEARGWVLVEAWADTMARHGTTHEPWAREAAVRVALAYKTRIEELLDSASAGGRA